MKNCSPSQSLVVPLYSVTCRVSFANFISKFSFYLQGPVMSERKGLKSKENLRGLPE